MPDISQLTVRIKGDEKNATDALDTVDKKVKEAGGSGSGGWKGILSNALSFAGGIGIAGAVAGAFSLIKDNIGEFISAGKDANTMDALLAAGLKSTKDASGETTGSLQSLADTLLAHTGITDNAAKAGEQMLLTYENIGKDVFPQAEQAVADMATRLNNGAIPSAQQMSQVALQLGKALNDPATGMTALRRVGVQFTKEQQDQIKAMEKAGNTAGAQKLILGELNKEFGGSAAAAGQANGGMAIFGATMDSLKEKVGQAIIPLFTGFLQNVVGPLASAFAQVLPQALGTLQGAISSVAPVVENLFNGVKFLASVFIFNLKPGLDAVGEAFSKLQGPGVSTQGLMTAIAQALRNATPIVRDLAQHFSDFLSNVVAPLIPKLRDFAGWLAGIVKQDVLANLHILGDLFDTVRKVVIAFLPHLQGLATAFQQNILPAIQFIVPLLLNLAQIIGQILGKALQFLLPIVGFLAGLLADVLAGALNIVGAVVRAVAPVIQGLGLWLAQHLVPIIGNVRIKLSELHEWFDQKILPVLQRLWAYFQANILPVLQKVGSFIAQQVVANLQTMWNFISTNVLPILQKIAGFLADQVGTAFQNFGNGINAVTTFIGNLFDAIGNLLGRLGDLKDKVGQVLSHLPHLPGLPSFAGGGVMGQSGLAVVGEQGPELVALPAGARIYSAAQTAQIASAGSVSASGAGVGGIGQQNITILLDGQVLARAAIPHMPNEVRIATGYKGW